MNPLRDIEKTLDFSTYILYNSVRNNGDTR